MGKRQHFRSVLSSSSFKGAKNTKTTLTSSAFDLIRAKPHHAVLNQNTRGQIKSQALANERSITKRKESLLLELKQRERQNAFVDRRIGEKDNGGQGERKSGDRDVMVERFIKERVRKMGKGRNYNLEEEGGEEEEQLTHAGQALSTVQFTGPVGDEYDEDDRHAGRIDADQVHALHFGGGTDPYSVRAAMGRGGEGDRGERSKKEVMDEIILKSKMYKAEKAEETAAQSNLISSLDSDFSSIRAILDYKDNRENRDKKAESAPVDDEDDFIKQTFLLAEEVKVRAADRVKSPEEEAKEEREKMERMERARLKRMRGEEVDEEEEEKDMSIGSRRKRRREQEKRERREQEQLEKERVVNKQSKVAPTDDDLVENFYVDKDTRRRQRDEEDEEEDEAVPVIATKRGVEQEEDEEAEDEEDEDDEDEDDENDDEEEDGEQAEGEAGADGVTKGQKPARPTSVKSVALTPEDEVPFVFEPPTSHRHWLSLLSPYSSSLHPLIYRRVHAYHFLALTADNRGKMEVFFTALLHHFHFLCKRHQPTTSTLSSLLTHLDTLTSILFDLLHHIPSHAAAASRQLLSSWSTSTCSGADVMTAKLLFDLFPSSDARHNVVTPLYLHLAATLMYSPLQSASDVLRALFTCQVILHATQESKRYMPELFNTLYGVLVRGWGIVIPETVKPEQEGMVPVYSKVFTSEMNVWEGVDMSQVVEEGEHAGWRVDLQAMFIDGDDQTELLSLPSFLSSLFALTLRLVTQSSRLYSYLSSYPELFTPFHGVLLHISQHSSSHLPSSLSTLLQSTLTLLSTSLRAARPSFGLPSVPHTIRQHTPAYIEGYQPGKDYDPVKERAEMRDLTKKMKKEKRGAEKEIRKDAEYVRAEEGRVRDAIEQAKREKRRANFRDMEAQARDSNLLHKTSKKNKKKDK